MKLISFYSEFLFDFRYLLNTKILKLKVFVYSKIVVDFYKNFFIETNLIFSKLFHLV